MLKNYCRLLAAYNFLQVCLNFMEILDHVCLKNNNLITVVPKITCIQVACEKIQQNGTKNHIYTTKL